MHSVALTHKKNDINKLHNIDKKTFVKHSIVKIFKNCIFNFIIQK